MISCGQNQNFLSAPSEWCPSLILFFTQTEGLCLAALGTPWPLLAIPHKALGWNVAGAGEDTATPWAKGLRMGSTGWANTWIYLPWCLDERPLASTALWGHGLRSTRSSETTLILSIFKGLKHFFKEFISFTSIKRFFKGTKTSSTLKYRQV